MKRYLAALVLLSFALPAAAQFTVGGRNSGTLDLDRESFHEIAADVLVAFSGGFSATTMDILSSWKITGTAVTSTAAELNILDGVTSTAAELNILDGVTSTAAELNILDGVTSTAAELNILDGVTATYTELNLIDGYTGTTAELNLIDGYTGTTANLNTNTDDSMADALHRHSELSASDGTPNPALTVDASGNVGIGAGVDVTPIGEGDDFMIETNDHVGMTLASPNDKVGGIYFASPADNDIALIQAKYNSGDQTLQFFTAGQPAVTIDGSHDVGVGTVDPSDNIHVRRTTDADAAIRIENTNTGTSADATLRLKAANGSGLSRVIYDHQSGSSWVQSVANDNDMRFSYGGSEKVTFLDGGNVGIGTDVPAERLHVYSTLGHSRPVAVFEQAGDDDVAIEFRAPFSPTSFFTGVYNNDFFIGTSVMPNVEVAHLTIKKTTGNVGIGTGSPEGMVHISTGTNAVPATSGSTAGGAIALRLQGANDGILDIGVNGGAGSWIQARDRTSYSSNYNLLLQPNGGNVGIGTTSPGSVLTVGGSHTPDFAQGITIDADLTASDGTTMQQAFFAGSLTTEDNTVTYSKMVGLEISEPDISKGASDTITLAASLYIAGAPDEGVTNAALYVNSGDVIINGGNVIIGSATASVPAGSVAAGGVDPLLALKGDLPIVFLENTDGTSYFFAAASDQLSIVRHDSPVTIAKYSSTEGDWEYTQGSFILNSGSATNDHDFEIQNGSTYSEIDAGESSFATSSSPDMKSDIQALTARQIADLRTVFADSLAVSSYHWKASALYDSTQFAQAAADTLTIPVRVIASVDELAERRATIEVDTITSTVDTLQVRTAGKITGTVDTLYIRTVSATAAAYSDTVLDPTYRYHTIAGVPDTTVRSSVMLASRDSLTGVPVWGRMLDTLLVATVDTVSVDTTYAPLVRHFAADTTWIDVPDLQPVRYDTSWVDVPTPQPARYDTTWHSVLGTVTSLERAAIADSVAAKSHGQYNTACNHEAADVASDVLVDRIGLMAPDAQRVSRILAPNDAPDGSYNGHHMQSALIALVGDLVRENRTLAARVDAIEASAHTH